ncbi:MAG: DUF6034 family protein [Clostridium sp.]|nr:DUF6034 family protein [Clostridium sp.]
MKQSCKRRYTFKNTALISTLIILTGIFTACGKPSEEDIAKDLGGDVTAATISDAAPIEEEIPKKLNYTINGAQGTIEVDADVYADGYGAVPTYNLKKYEKDDEWLAQHAENFFDDGEYENVKPYRVCSLEELEQEKSFCEELLSQYGTSDPAYSIIEKEKTDIERAIDNYVEAEYVKYPDDKLIYEFDSSIISQDGKPLNYERAHLKGQADGKLWYMSYERGNYTGIAIDDEIYEDPMGCLYGVCPENTPNIEYTTKNDIGVPNKCDRGMAEKEAEKLLEAFGLENMKLVNITFLRVATDENDDGEYVLDGYSLTYALSVNGVDLLYGASAATVGEETHMNNMAVQPFIKIEVSSDGIFGFCMYEQYEIGDALAKSSSMLSFEQVNNEVKSYYEQALDYNRINVKISEVRFGYVCITYDGISYAMVPAWRYFMVVNSNIANYPLITVNALDGSFLLTGDYSYTDYEFMWLD